MSFVTKERLLVLLLIATAAITGYYFGNRNKPVVATEVIADTEEKKGALSIKEKRKGGKFTNPLLECDCAMPEGIIATGFLHDDVVDYISLAKANGAASHISVYFRDLNNGPWFGIDEEANFTPASLLKVPLMIAVFKRAGHDPLFLNRKIEYSKPTKYEFAQRLIQAPEMVIGQSYAVRELVSQMIIYSDNRATDLLMLAVGENEFKRVFSDMQVVSSEDETGDNLISVKEYSSFFRILYNASYLSKEYSEMALEILSKSLFKDGLVDGVPAGFEIAHKFGERNDLGLGLTQLHDCGIVYIKNNPYLICVMTRGKNYEKLCSVISDISSMVYRNVSSNSLP